MVGCTAHSGNTNRISATPATVLGASPSVFFWGESFRKPVPGVAMSQCAGGATPQPVLRQEFRRPYASRMGYPDNLCQHIFVCWNGLKIMKTKAIGYVRVSTDKQVEHGVSLEAQVEKIRAMATVHDVELLDVLVDAGESAKDLDRPGMVRILEMVQARAVGMVIVAKLDRLTRSVKDLAVLMEQFQRRGVSLVSVAESLDTGSASGRLVLNIMVSVSQWEREAIGER